MQILRSHYDPQTTRIQCWWIDEHGQGWWYGSPVVEDTIPYEELLARQDYPVAVFEAMHETIQLWHLEQWWRRPSHG